MRSKGLGSCARQLVLEVSTIRSMDIILPVKNRGQLRLRVVARPDKPVVALYLNRRLRPFTALNSWTGSRSTAFNSQTELHLNRRQPQLHPSSTEVLPQSTI